MSSADSMPCRYMVVASRLGPHAEVEADLIVAQLRASGIAAVRVPVLPMMVLLDASLPGVLPVHVLAPADSAEAAAEAISEPPAFAIHPRVRPVAQWLTAAGVVGMLAQFWAMPYELQTGWAPEWPPIASWAYTLTISGAVVAAIILAVALMRERRGLREWRLLPVAALVHVVLSVIAMACGAGYQTGPGEVWPAVMVMGTVAMAISAVLWRMRRSRQEPDQG